MPIKQTPCNPVICRYDPTNTYAGVFDQASFKGSFWDKVWPDRTRWELALTRNEPRSMWELRDNRLWEIGGQGRVLASAGSSQNPQLKVIRYQEAKL